MALIRQGTIKRLRRLLAPDYSEGTAFIRRNSRIRDGAGWKDVELVVGPIPARYSFIANQGNTERIIAGKPEGEHRYLIEMAAFTAILETDKIVATPTWFSQHGYKAGDLIAATPSNKFSYQALSEGISGLTPPVYPLQVGATVVDGGVTWRNAGTEKVFEVIEIGQVDSYEVTREVYCQLAS